jgi:hypothetical protein
MQGRGSVSSALRSELRFWHHRQTSVQGSAGPPQQAQVEPAEDTVVAFAGADAASERTQTVAQFALDVGMPVAWVGATEGPARTQPLLVPDVGEQLAAIVALIPAQLLAAHLAAQRGVDADDFRLGEAAFKQAFERYDL